LSHAQRRTEHDWGQGVAGSNPAVPTGKRFFSKTFTSRQSQPKSHLHAKCAGAAIFGMFFFLTVFMQTVWGYSALKTGVAYLPLTGVILVFSGAAAQLVSRVGARPLLLAAAPTVAGGLYWLSRIGLHSNYAGAVLGPLLVIAAGLGLLFVPATLVAMSRVADKESGVAASIRNTGQQIGGSIGLAVLGTVAWTAVANSIHTQTARRGQGSTGRPSGAPQPGSAHRGLPPRPGYRFLPRLSGRGRDHAARPGHHNRRDPGQARRPWRGPILNHRATGIPGQHSMITRRET